MYYPYRRYHSFNFPQQGNYRYANYPQQGNYRFANNPLQGNSGYSNNPTQGNSGNANNPLQGNNGYVNNPPQGNYGYANNPPQGSYGYVNNPPQGNYRYANNPPQGSYGYVNNPPQGNYRYANNPPQGSYGYVNNPPQGNYRYANNPPQGSNGYLNSNMPGAGKPINNTAAPEIRLADNGPGPFVVNIDEAAKQNGTFRTALWTGEHLQLTLMNINPGEDIGFESHPGLDQFIRIEEGSGILVMGDQKDNLDFQKNVSADDALIIPAGKWHNLVNSGRTPLKLYSIYTQAQHPFGIVQTTKAETKPAENKD